MKKYVVPLLILHFTSFIFTSCSIQNKVSKSATRFILKDSSLTAAHIGISIFDPATNKYWYNYQGDHYFIPASNTKIPTCYAAMKYLGDSLAGVSKTENDTAVFIFPTADPTLLHPDFKNQPVMEFLQKTRKKIYTTDITWQEQALGPGWSWNDYNESYMAERSPMPVYGNLITWIQEKENDEPAVIYSIPEINWEVNFDTTKGKYFSVVRNISENIYSVTESGEKKKETEVPFATHGVKATIELLSDTLRKTISALDPQVLQKLFSDARFHINVIHSQPTDSLLKPMMHRSDNFFAEQSLLMVSNHLLLGIMNDEKIIDTLLKTDFKNLPQKPRWVDGSGLSRYNLFSPQDFVFIFNKMKNEFGMDRMKNILPTGNEGTLNNYYKSEKGYIFAKTGSLSGVVSLSGFLYTKKNKLLIFSVLVNNSNSSSTEVRRAVEKFIEGVYHNY
ncbi:MAG TPA: D-alanyl-D-alanine carboxypeptidase/D-alanyl-D-alanine-endopeptidase [Chitinophagaceae bacterium]|nr:D-alanyl-D-alanine carboxypeptidase/D-alanyl-D-alanine-endopeptidase [Chitinophagaceae bacterium]